MKMFKTISVVVFLCSASQTIERCLLVVFHEVLLFLAPLQNSKVNNLI